MEAARAGLVMTKFRKPKRASTIAIDEGRVSRHIVPLIGQRIASELCRTDVQRMADAIASGKTAGTFETKAHARVHVAGGAGTAARVAELLGGIWSWAERRGLVSGPNPARGVETHRGEAKDRVLSKNELASLGKALREYEGRSPMAGAAIRLSALTGLRRQETVGLQWREIDFDGSCLRLAETKTGRSTRPIGKKAVEHLRALPRLRYGWLFPNRNGTGSAALTKSIHPS